LGLAEWKLPRLPVAVAAALEEIRVAIPDSLRLRLEVEQDWAIRGLQQDFHSFHSSTELCGCKAWGMNYHDDVA
jgi:hypothetical protein